jgi:ubiquinone/menaquinone biosynthesis C-methylase UbiE
MNRHLEKIVSQFTSQAKHFAQMPGHNDEESLRLIAELAHLSPSDEVLDVACGSGIVARAFARLASNATGIDITPAMLTEGRRLAEVEGLANTDWREGDIANLPWPDGTFSMVVSRYAFHHLLDPEPVLREMVRVCQPGGRVVLVDAVLPVNQLQAYNAFEKLLDPTHTTALSFDDLDRLVEISGLKNLRFAFYRMEMELEQQLSTSFPAEGDAEKVRELLRNDVGHDRIGINAHWRGEELHYAYPVTIVVGEKAASE